MSALSKFKNLFGEKSKNSNPKQKVNHLKEVKAESPSETNTKRVKAEVEILQKKIREKIKNDPKLQKKAAMILENMLNGKKQK